MKWAGGLAPNGEKGCRGTLSPTAFCEIATMTMTLPTGPALPTSTNRPLNDQVHQQLRWRLTCGHYRPGQALSIRSLTEEFGTSMMPIREALKRLAAERALEVTPNRAFRVPRLDTDRIVGLFAIRKTLESMATRLAATHLNKRQIAALAQAEWAMRDAIARNDPTAYFVANYTFHFTIYSASANDDLVALIEGIWVLTGPGLASTIEAKGFTEEWKLFHIDAVNAFRAANVDAACAAIETDIEWAMRHFLAQAAQSQAQG